MRFEFSLKLVAYMFAGLGLIALMLGTTLTPADSMIIMVAFVASWFAESPLIDRSGYSRSMRSTPARARRSVASMCVPQTSASDRPGCSSAAHWSSQCLLYWPGGKRPRPQGCRVTTAFRTQLC